MANGKRRTRNRRDNGGKKGSHSFPGRRGGGKPSQMVNKAAGSRGG